MKRLDGKIALITGGTSGIGAATAKLFAEEGATVVATGSSTASVAAARATLANVEFVESDASDPKAAADLVERVRGAHGRIDVLFVNAGIARIAPIAEMEEAVFDELFAVNLRGPYFLLKHAVPVLADGAAIILTSSTAAVQGMAGLSAYGASKAALRALGLSLGVELAPRGIRVNTITPGPIDTPIGGKMNLSAEQIADFQQMIAKVPFGRPGRPEEIAAAALYFATDGARFTTGAELRLDGGMSLV